MNSIDRRLTKLQAKVSRERAAEREHQGYFDITLVEAPRLSRRLPRSWRSAPAGATIPPMDGLTPQAAEIEITPEMIEAGRETLYGFPIMEPTEDKMNAAVVAVFRAMYIRRPRSGSDRAA